jgi:alpha-L-rhamnosidase
VPDLFRLLGPDAVPQLDGTAVWGDAAVWVPWALWEAYGDLTVLESSYASMAAHVRRVLALRSERGVVDSTREFGDWLDPDAPADMPWQAKTPAAVVATACLHRSARLLADAAAVLDRRADSAAFAAAADEVRAAFQQAYVQSDGTVTGDAPTGYALAIAFGLLDDDQQRLAGARLAALVEQSDFRISTGFAGTPYVCDALTTTGHVDTAYRLLLQREAPSWLHPVLQGATTIWERWDSLLPDGTPNPDGMTSFNHYALGAVADFVHRVVGGIAPLEPGYARVLVAPRPGGDLTWADTSLTTGHGTISVRWRLDGDLMHTTIELPEGVPARLAPGGAAARDVVGGVHEISGPVRRLAPH